MELTNGLAEYLSAASLARRNGTTRSNTIGQKLWCAVGARESCAGALEVGSWQGFPRSLTDAKSPAAVQAALGSSMTLVSGRVGALPVPVDESREVTLLTLLKHEVQHHGELIRDIYANDLPFSGAFASRYGLD